MSLADIQLPTFNRIIHLLGGADKAFSLLRFHVYVRDARVRNLLDDWDKLKEKEKLSLDVEALIKKYEIDESEMIGFIFECFFDMGDHLTIIRMFSIICDQRPLIELQRFMSNPAAVGGSERRDYLRSTGYLPPIEDEEENISSVVTRPTPTKNNYRGLQSFEETMRMIDD